MKYDPAGLKVCNNHACERLTNKGTDFCCYACSIASGKYDIHDDGSILSHSVGCNNRHDDKTQSIPEHVRETIVCFTRQYKSIGGRS